AKFRELDRECADPTGGTVNDHLFARFQLENIVNALQGRQSTDCQNSRLGRANSAGDVSDVIRSKGHVFGIKGGTDPVDRVTHFETAHPRPHRSDSTRAIRPEDQRRVRVLRVARPLLCLPAPYSRGIYRDQYFARVGFAHRYLMYRERRSVLALVESRGAHRIRHRSCLSHGPNRGDETQSSHHCGQSGSSHGLAILPLCCERTYLDACRGVTCVGRLSPGARRPERSSPQLPRRTQCHWRFRRSYEALPAAQKSFLRYALHERAGPRVPVSRCPVSHTHRPSPGGDEAWQPVCPWALTQGL